MTEERSWSELDVLRDVSERFARADIPFMLTGSFAMTYYAQPRMTRDIDVVVELRDVPPLLVASIFEPDYYVSDTAISQALADQSMFNIVHMASVIKVDLIVRKRSVYRDLEFKRRQPIRLGDFETWIVSAEDLILSKLHWAKDSRSELQLRDVDNLLHGQLDVQYMRQWASQLGVAELLEERFNERHST